jgi:aspartate/methionine/tyrosine aminotransferase
MVVSKFNEIEGIDCPSPDGSFYVFPSIRGTGMTAQQFADYLVEDYGVGVVAGNAFGDRGEGHIRFTYAAPDEQLEEGLDRIKKAVEAL